MFIAACLQILTLSHVDAKSLIGGWDLRKYVGDQNPSLFEVHKDMTAEFGFVIKGKIKQIDAKTFQFTANKPSKTLARMGYEQRIVKFVYKDKNHLLISRERISKTPLWVKAWDDMRRQWVKVDLNAPYKKLLERVHD